MPTGVRYIQKKETNSTVKKNGLVMAKLKPRGKRSDFLREDGRGRFAHSVIGARFWSRGPVYSHTRNQ